MKKSILIITSYLTSVFFLSACQTDLSELNSIPNDATQLLEQTIGIQATPQECARFQAFSDYQSCANTTNTGCYFSDMNGQGVMCWKPTGSSAPTPNNPSPVPSQPPLPQPPSPTPESSSCSTYSAYQLITNCLQQNPQGCYFSDVNGAGLMCWKEVASSNVPNPNPTPTPVPLPDPIPIPASNLELPPCTTTISTNSSIVNSFNSLAQGQTLCLRTGVYPQRISDLINSANSWNGVKTIRPFGDGPVTITGGIYLGTSDAKYIAINGGPRREIILRGSSSADGVKLTSSGTSYATAAHHIRIAQCEITAMSRQGVQTTDHSEYNEFLYNHIHSGGNNRFDHGFYVATSYNLMEGNIVHDWSGYGVHTYNGHESDNRDATQVASYNILRNNIVYRTGRSADSRPENGGYIAGIAILSGTGNEVYNNISFNNEGYGIQVDGCFGVSCGYDLKIYNNTFYGNKREAIAIGGATKSGEIANNIIYNNGGRLTGQVSVLREFANYFLDPLFIVSTPQVPSHFRLQPGSPATNTGTPVRVLLGFSSNMNAQPDDQIVGTRIYRMLNYDIELRRRPESWGIDIGAYER